MLRNAAGVKTTLFLPEAAFESLVKRRVEALRDPSLQLVDLVYGELLRLALDVRTPVGGVGGL